MQEKLGSAKDSSCFSTKRSAQVRRRTGQRTIDTRYYKIRISIYVSNALLPYSIIYHQVRRTKAPETQATRKISLPTRFKGFQSNPISRFASSRTMSQTQGHLSRAISLKSRLHPFQLRSRIHGHFEPYS